MSTYNFTALLEADLLQGVNGSSIGYGDTFVMPEGATVEFIVTDDDNTLSGDYYNNEYGDDTSQQTADISVNGQQVFNDVKIYAEQYHVLQGSDGQTYYMMEIEVAGSDNAPGDGDDFFTFWGWTPPAGVSLTVTGTYNVTCDWMDYTCLTGGDLIVIEPENTAPEAVDDAYVTDENTTITANLLDNDSDADGDVISVTAIQGGNVGEAFQVTTAQGHTGMVTVQADGTFTFDPDDNFKALAQDEQDSFQLTYTITDDPEANVKHNLMFVLDISNSTVGTTGNNVFDGTGVGDVNGDGLSNTVLDAEIAAVLAAVQNLIDEGVDPANIDIGIATFSGVAAGFASVDAETLGTFALNDGGLAAALQGIQSGGWTNYEAGLQQAENWFASQAGDGALNKLVFLSDGRPIVGYDYSAGQYITQTNADYGDEVSRIANDYGADIYGIGVGANSDLDYLNDLDNTGGAERVTDASTLNVVVNNAVAQPASSTATVTVTINGLNEAPDAVNDQLIVNEDETGSINILANDSDADGDAITLLDVDGNAPGDSFEVTTSAGRTGTVTVQADGTFNFDPGQDFIDLAQGESETITLNYTITDGQLGANLIVNGDFENHGTLTRGDTASGNAWDTFDTIEGWYTPVGVLEIQQGTHHGTPINSTTNSVLEVDSHDSVDTNASVVQDITVAEAGTFEFNFDYSPRQLGSEIGSTSVLNVWVNGAIVATLSSDTLGYEAQSITIELQAGQNTVGFSGGGTDDTYGALVDNVSLREVITDTAQVEIIVNGLNEGPDALNDALTVSESEVGSINILANDSDPENDTLTITDIDGNAVGSTFTVTTNDGRSGTVTVDAAGNLSFDPGAGFEDLNDTQTDSFTISYTISDGQFTDTATITVTVNGEGEPVDAVDDAFSIEEQEDIAANLLVNDTPNDGSLTVVGVAEDGTQQTVGQSFTVTTDGGREGTVTVDENGNFTFDGGDNFVDLAAGQTDTVDITYTVEGEATAGEVPKHNILFVIDVSGSTSPAEFGGSAVGDQNGDGVENSVLDAEIAAYKELSQKIADSGLTADKVDIGLISFSSTGATQFLGTFDAGSGSLDAALEGLTDGGLTNFEEPLQVGIQWFEDQAATTDDKNIVYFLSDGMQNTGGTFDDEAGELATRFGAELNAVGVGNGAVLSQLEQIDNTNGAEIVTTTDALTAALVDTAPVIPGDQDTATVTITINGVGVGAGDDALQTDEKTAASIDLLANDSAPAGQGLCVFDVSGAAATGANVGSAFMVTTAAGRQGMVTVQENGTFAFDPEDGFISLAEAETDSFTLNYTMASGAMFGELSYELFDGTPTGNTVANIPTSGAVASGTVADLNVGDLAVAATGSAQSYSIRYTGVLTIEEAGNYDFNLGSDDGSALFINGVQVIDNDGLHGVVNVPGVANLSAGQHSIEILFFQNGGGAGLNLSYSGIDTGGVATSVFPAVASQAFETAEAVVEVTVLGLDSAPVAVDDALVTDENTAATINLLANDSDPEDDALTVVSIEGGSVGTPMSVTTADGRTGSVTVLADGTFSFDPETGFEGLAQGETDTITLTYTATDGVVGDTATVTVTVNGLNAAPVAVNDTLTTTEDTAASINILSNDSDPDGDAIQIVEVNGKAAGDVIDVITGDGRTGTVTYQTDGTLTFTPDSSFEDLNDGESDTVTLTYSISDGQFADNATVTVLVNGTGNPNGQVTVTGSISASVTGQSHIVLVLDTSFNSINLASAQTVADLDMDGNAGTIFDGMLQKIVDLAGNLQDGDLITLVPSGYSENADTAHSFSYTAGQINAAAGSVPALQALFNPIVSTVDELDFSIDMPQGLAKAESILAANSTDNNQVMVLTTSEHPDQAASVAAAESLELNVNAEIDILYIDAGDFVNVSNLNAIDSDDIDTDNASGTFGLTTLLEPAPTSLAPVESFEVFVDGNLVAGVDASDLTVNATNDGFDFTGDIDLNGLEGVVDIVVALDSDLDATTAAEVFTLSDTVSEIDRTVMDGDTFMFDFT